MSEILLVADREELPATLAAVLAPLGYPLHTATSAPEAIRLIEERDLALVVLDARMPGHVALETARLIKGRGRTQAVPVVFVAPDRASAEQAAGGYWIGTVDYVQNLADADLLRSKVAAFAELETSRLALQRSEAFLRGAFEAAPIGKTVLDDAWQIVRANRAFARLLGRDPADLLGADVTELARPSDRGKLTAALHRVAAGAVGPADPERSGFDVHLRSDSGSYAWLCAYLSSIDPAELDQPLLLIQWVDLSPRRRAERADAELRLEHSARTLAEQTAERLHKLQLMTDALETLSLHELVPALALRLVEQFDAQLAEVVIDARDSGEPVASRAAGGELLSGDSDDSALPGEIWEETPLVIEGQRVGVLRLAPSAEAPLDAPDQSLLVAIADRAAVSIRRAQLHEQEHRIAATLQRGLLPKRLPRVPGLELTAHYEPAGDVVEVGGDWYDAFALTGDRLGLVLGDVAGKGIPAASTMGQLRTVTRAFALGDQQTRSPGDVLTRLNRYQLALGAEEMFTVLYAILDPGRGLMWWANAGHPPPLLRSHSGETRYLEGGNGLMGIDDVLYTDLHQPLADRDTLILYTDGLVERRGEALDAGLERLALAAAAGPENPRALCEHVVAQVVPAKRSPHDDVTAVVVRISDGASSGQEA